MRACVGAAVAAGSDRIAAGSAGGAAGLKRTGRLVALATANRGSALASAFASGLASACGSTLAAATFGSGLVTTMGSGLGSALAATTGSGLASALALVTTMGSGLTYDVPLASAIIGAVRLVDACAILLLISSRMRASRLPSFFPSRRRHTR